MVEEAQEVSSGLFPQAGPHQGENHTLPDANMSRRSAQLIGRQLAQIGDELDSRWSEKLPNQWPRQAFPNMLTCTVMNGKPNGYRRIMARLWWSKVMPVVQASWLVPLLHTQACQGAMQWIGRVYNSHFPDWSGRTKCCLASAVLLFTAAAFTASQETSES
ncbi:hypothetical protein P4O66_014347 [Electrophorus voltai]|uniref:BCL2 interacting killer n=1 Tax=Electrophorus voltai TaxID=2609070 RepID=A0AAD8Z0N3_9TELE|nr:hypothetical protein P4O66_014347 [Electrophorus voltai]